MTNSKVTGRQITFYYTVSRYCKQLLL